MITHKVNKYGHYSIKKGFTTDCGKATKGWTKVKNYAITIGLVTCKDCLKAGAV